MIDDGLPPGIDGHLGLSFFLRFHVTPADDGRALLLDARSK